MAPCLRWHCCWPGRDWLGPVPSLHAHASSVPGKGTGVHLLNCRPPRRPSGAQRSSTSSVCRRTWDLGEGVTQRGPDPERGPPPSGVPPRVELQTLLL